MAVFVAERPWNGLVLPIARRTQIPIAPAARTLVSLTAVSFPGGFRTTAPVLVASSNMGPSSETLHTSRRDDYIDLMSGVPQKAADLLQRASQQVWANCRQA